MSAPDRPTVLVIDDDAAIRDVISRQLRSAGYVVQETTDGKKALESLRGGGIDLVLVDVYMPNMDGFEFLVRSRGIGIPVITMSGGGSLGRETVAEIASQFGATKTIEKPFTRQEILDAVSAALHRA